LFAVQLTLKQEEFLRVNIRFIGMHGADGWRRRGIESMIKPLRLLHIQYMRNGCEINELAVGLCVVLKDTV